MLKTFFVKPFVHQIILISSIIIDLKYCPVERMSLPSIEKKVWLTAVTLNTFAHNDMIRFSSNLGLI